MAIKAVNPKVRIVGVEAARSPGMARSVEAGHVVTLDTVGPMIDGLVVRRVGTYNLEVVRKFVDDIVLVDERKIFDAVVWMMLEGQAEVRVDGLAETTPVKRGETILLPAAMKNPVIRTRTDCTWIEVTFPH